MTLACQSPSTGDRCLHMNGPTLILYRLNSDEKTLADSLDYEKEESRKLGEKVGDLLKKLQEANSATERLQGEINSKC